LLCRTKAATKTKKATKHGHCRYSDQPIANYTGCVMDMISVKQERLILGTDRWDAEKQIDLWLAQNPEIKIIRIHEIRREPSSLLTFIGGRHVPRVSVRVEYQCHKEDARTDVRDSPAVAPTKNNDCEGYADSGRDQSTRENLLAAQAHSDVEEMAQQRGHQHCRKDDAE
jgi:hypothetical protein